MAAAARLPWCMLVAIACLTALPSFGLGQHEPSFETPKTDDLPPLALQRLVVSNEVEAKGSVAQIKLSHNGQMLAVRKQNHSVQVWDLSSGKLVRTWYNPTGAIFDVCFSANDKLIHVATGMYKPGIRTWNIDTGEAQDPIAFPALKIDAATESTIWAVGTRSVGELDIVPPSASRIDQFAGDLHPLFADAATKTVVGYDRVSGAAGQQFTLSVFGLNGDPTTGSSWINPNYSGFWTVQPTATIDRVVAKPRAAHLVRGVQADYVAYLISGVRRVSLRRLGGGYRLTWDAKSPPVCLTASRDGRFLAVGCEDGHVRIWELLTGGMVGEFVGTGETIRSLEFAADTGTIVSGAAEPGGVVVWDVGALLTGAGQEAREAELDFDSFARAWTQLGEHDPAKAIQGIRQLVQDVDRAMPLVVKAIDSAIIVPQQNQIDRWVANLRSAEYSVRTEAYARLLDLRDIIGDQLDNKLDAGQPAEIRLQLKRILGERNKSQGDNVPASRQAMRALWFLDFVGNESALTYIRRLEIGHRSAEVRGTAKRIREARSGDR